MRDQYVLCKGIFEDLGAIDVFAVEGRARCEDAAMLGPERNHLEILPLWSGDQTLMVMVDLTVVVAADPKEPRAAVAPLRLDHLLLGAL